MSLMFVALELTRPTFGKRLRSNQPPHMPIPTVGINPMAAHADYLPDKLLANRDASCQTLIGLLRAERHVECSTKTMRTWLSANKADLLASERPMKRPAAPVLDINELAAYEVQLREFHRQGMGDKAMRTALSVAHHVTCSRKTVRNWLQHEKEHPGMPHRSIAHSAVQKRPAAAQSSMVTLDDLMAVSYTHLTLPTTPYV